MQIVLSSSLRSKYEGYIITNIIILHFEYIYHQQYNVLVHCTGMKTDEICLPVSLDEVVIKYDLCIATEGHND